MYSEVGLLKYRFWEVKKGQELFSTPFRVKISFKSDLQFLEQNKISQQRLKIMSYFDMDNIKRYIGRRNDCWQGISEEILL